MFQQGKVPRTVVFGEVLIDLFSRSGGAVRHDEPAFQFDGMPGGAPANVAMHLAEYGQAVRFVTGFADDPAGGRLREMFIRRGVDVSFASTYPQSRTPLASVSLSPTGERTFRLYLRGSVLEQLHPELAEGDCLNDAYWFHFGSVMMAFPSTYSMTKALVDQARRRQVVVSCDVNIRPDVWEETGADPADILDVLASVDVLKLSDEDFAWMRAHCRRHLNQPTDLLNGGPRLIAVTHGAHGATLLTNHAIQTVPPPAVHVVDTTGAGDAFTAGLIMGLQRLGVSHPADIDAVDAMGLQQVGYLATQLAGRVLGQKGAV